MRRQMSLVTLRVSSVKGENGQGIVCVVMVVVVVVVVCGVLII